MLQLPKALPWYLGPWGLLLTAVGLAFLGVVLSLFPNSVTTPLRVGLLTIALCLAGGGVWWRLRALSRYFDERLEPAALLGAAAGVALLAALACDVGDPQQPLFQTTEYGQLLYNKEYNPGWDSLRMLFNVMTGVALGGAALILMPWDMRKWAICAITLFHFGGILTASSSAPTSAGGYPWLPSQLWNRVYRPYLCFMYLNNAYHFYSPEPGPATMLWFRVEFEDGSARWVRIAEREDSSTRLDYQRMLALTEQVNQTEVSDANKVGALLEARQVAGMTRDIPLAPGIDVATQYRELTHLSKAYVASYVRHLAGVAKHETKPELKVKSIKVYRATHDIIRPGDLAQRASPRDPTLYYIWFNGEFVPEGANGEFVLRDHRKVPGWEGLPQDPFLYWMIPVYRRPKNLEDPQGEQEVVDCLKKHAGDAAMIEWETWPGQYHRQPRKVEPKTKTDPNTPERIKRGQSQNESRPGLNGNKSTTNQ